MIDRFSISVSFFIERGTNVRFRVKWRGEGRTETFSINVPVHVDPAKWSRETMRCRVNSYHYGVSATDINRELNRYEEAAGEVFARHRGEGLSPEEFRRRFREAVGRATPRTEEADIFHAYDQFVRREGERWAESTLKKFRTLRKILYGWNPGLRFEEITPRTLDAFIGACVAKGYRNSYIKKLFGLIRWFLNWARKNGYTTNAVTDTYRYKFKGTDGGLNVVVYLTWEELMRLHHYDFAKDKHLERVRDVFCFCCFTSLRYSDVAKLQWSDVYDDCIKVVAQKTSELLVIELNKHSRAILDKYRREDGGNSGLALPVISNQKMNQTLKEVARIAGFDEPVRRVHFVGSERVEEVSPKWELVTTHCGRRTFIVNAMYLGIPAEVVMKWTGHADYKSMKPYIAIADRLKAESMAKFDRD